MNVKFMKGRSPSHPPSNLEIRVTPRTKAETIQPRWCWEVAGPGCTVVCWRRLTLTHQRLPLAFLPNSVVSDGTMTA